MKKRSIVLKLWLAFSGLILVVMVPLELALHRLLTDFYSRQVTEPLLYHSRQLAEMIGKAPSTVLNAASMADMVGGEVIVLDRQGQPVQFPGQSSLPPPLESVQKSLSGGSSLTEIEYSGGRSFIVAAVPVPGVGGAVLLLAPAEPVKRSLNVARRYVWLAGAGTMLIGTGLALGLSRQLLQPVIAIEHATKSIAGGDLSTRVTITSNDELGQLAASVNQMTAQLERYENNRREFLANVAHELRTPLSYIRGYTQALSEGLITVEEERTRYQRIVQEEAVRLGRLVDDLMDLAQMEEGQMAFSFAALDIRVPIEQAGTTIQPLAEEKGVHLSVALSDDLPSIRGDGGRLQQVVINLLDNSVRHTPPGGSVNLSALSDGQDVVVRVADTGPGIDPEVLPVVFDRFYKRHSSGRGLGLAIVRSIIQAHAGEVGVDSQVGTGTTFWFRIPRTSTSDSQDRPKS